MSVFMGTRISCRDPRRIPSHGSAFVSLACAKQIGCLFAYEDARCIGVSRRHGWKNRRVSNAEPLQAVHAKLVIDDRIRALPHAASADGMIRRLRILPDPVENLVIALNLLAGRELFV